MLLSLVVATRASLFEIIHKKTYTISQKFTRGRYVINSYHFLFNFKWCCCCQTSTWSRKCNSKFELEMSLNVSRALTDGTNPPSNHSIPILFLLRNVFTKNLFMDLHYRYRIILLRGFRILLKKIKTTKLVEKV